jgi:branched-chain amino acid aminotransferase
VIAGLDVEEGSFPDADLRGAQSAFLASTTREIQPIAAIDGEALPDVGSGHAEAAAAALREAIGREHAEAEA